jgi:hypothetical protein
MDLDFENILLYCIMSFLTLIILMIFLKARKKRVDLRLFILGLLIVNIYNVLTIPN